MQISMVREMKSGKEEWKEEWREEWREEKRYRTVDVV